MPHSSKKTVELFRKEIEVLQQNARSCGDIQRGLAKHRELLRAVTTALRRQDVDAPAGQDIPLTRLELDSELVMLIISGGELRFRDKYMDAFQVYSKIAYHLDKATSLELILLQLPELGMHLINDDAEEEPGQFNEGRLFFSPAKWPIVASELILELYSQNHSWNATTADMLLRDFYPSTNVSTLRSMIDAGLFAGSPGLLCDWLLENEEKKVLHLGEAPCPKDF